MFTTSTITIVRSWSIHASRPLALESWYTGAQDISSPCPFSPEEEVALGEVGRRRRAGRLALLQVRVVGEIARLWLDVHRVVDVGLVSVADIIAGEILG